MLVNWERPGLVQKVSLAFKTMLCFSFSFPFTVLATINLQSQHELQLLTNFLLSVQVSLAQGQLPALLGVSVESPRVKWSLCRKCELL